MRHASAIRFWGVFVLLALVNLAGWAWVRHSAIAPVPLDRVHLVRTSSVKTLAKQGHFTLFFDRPIFLERDEDTSDINALLANPPIEWTPPIPGAWSATTPQSLQFEPFDPPTPGQAYRLAYVATHPLLAAHDLRGIALPVLDYQPPQVKGFTLAEVGEPGNGVSLGNSPVRVRLGFSQNIAPTALREAATMFVNNAEVSFELADGEPDRMHELVLEAPLGATVKVAIDSSLSGASGDLTIGAPWQRSLVIPKKLELLRANASSWRSGYPEVRLSFSRRLNPAHRNPAVTITPPIDGAVRTLIRGTDVVLTGDFSLGKTYTIQLAPPLVSKDGQPLLASAERTVTIPPREPSISFPNTKGRLSASGNLEIPFQHVNVETAKLLIFRLPERNLPYYLSGVATQRELRAMSTLLADREIDLGVFKRNDFHSGVLQLEGILPRTPGFYIVSLYNPGDYWWSRDSMLLEVGGLALELQSDSKGLLAWVTHAEDAEPVEGALVRVYDKTNATIAQGNTDANGLIRLSAAARWNGKLVTAAWDNDITFLDPRDARGLEDASFAGAQWPDPLLVHLYAERGIHRPGESIHLSGLLRTDAGAIVEGLSLELDFIRPDGKRMRRFTVQPSDEQGHFALTIPTDHDAPSGNWRVHCHLPGDTKTLGSLTCGLMPFVPVRLAVDATAGSFDATANTVALDVSATYLNNAPAAQLPVSISFRTKRIRYTNDAFPGFLFENPLGARSAPKASDGTLDAQGARRFDLAIPAQPGLWRTRVEASVRELGGRSSTKTLVVDTDTSKAHLGVRSAWTDLVTSKAPVLRFDVVNLDASGQAIDCEAPEVTIVSVDHTWTRVAGNSSNAAYHWRRIEQIQTLDGVETSWKQAQDGINTLMCNALPAGAYRLKLNDNERSVQLDFHVAGPNHRALLDGERIDQVQLVIPETPARPGDEIDVLLRSPFAGRALVTIETDHILETHVVNMADRNEPMRIRVPESVRGTCFIGATVLRGFDPTATTWQPLRATGAVRLRIDRSAYALEPIIVASDGAKPGEPVTVRVVFPDEETKATQARHVHLWAVEEGALLPTDYHAVDPADELLKPRRRIVATLDTRSFFMPDHVRSADFDRIGGDGVASNRSPVPIRMRNTQVLWREAVRVDGSGELETTFVMPEIDGAMRLMAIAFDGDRYGASEHKIAVAAPLAMQLVTPRAASPGDRMSIPVALANRTQNPIEVQLSLQLPATLTGSLVQTSLKIPAFGQANTTLELEATGLGVSQVTLRAMPTGTVGLAPIEQEHSIAIRPPHGRQHETVRVHLEPGAREAIKRNQNITTLDGQIEVSIAPRATIPLRPLAQSLIDYPYGCGEQTLSRTRGLLAIHRFESNPTELERDTLENMIAFGLSRLHGMQRTDGMIPYWPGNEGSTSLTLHAGLLLAEANLFAQPNAFSQPLRQAVQGIGRRQGNATNSRERAIAARVLAALEAPDLALLETLAAQSAELGTDARAHLAVAFSILGENDKAELMLQGLVPPRITERTGYLGFTSALTQTATLLDALLRVSPNDPRVNVCIDQMRNYIEQNEWLTTFEEAAVLESLARQPAQPDDIAETSAFAGRFQLAGEQRTFSGSETLRFRIPVPADVNSKDWIELDEGSDAYVTIRASGFGVTNTSSAAAESNGIRVKRVLKRINGDELLPDKAITPGTLLVAELTIQSIDNVEYENVAIVDVLPGGLEFELPALKTSAGTKSAKLNEVDRVEFHDDRLVAFATVGKEPKTLRYVLRAVVAGDWAQPAAEGVAMYVQ